MSFSLLCFFVTILLRVFSFFSSLIFLFSVFDPFSYTFITVYLFLPTLFLGMWGFYDHKFLKLNSLTFLSRFIFYKLNTFIPRILLFYISPLYPFTCISFYFLGFIPFEALFFSPPFFSYPAVFRNPSKLVQDIRLSYLITCRACGFTFTPSPLVYVTALLSLRIRLLPSPGFTLLNTLGDSYSLCKVGRLRCNEYKYRL